METFAKGRTLPAMSRLNRCLGLALLCVIQIAVRADTLSDDLNREYQNRVLGVRYPIHASNLEFDSAGHPANPGPATDWEIYGGVLVDKVRLTKDQVHIEGTRVVPSGPAENGKPAVIRLGNKTNFEIHLDHPLTSMDEANDVLGRVFYLDANDAQHTKPQVRRAGSSADIEMAIGFRGKTPDFTPPKAQYFPEPDFSETARRENVHGTELLSVVVDKTGTVVAITIERGLGYGLDESAIDSVKTWRFSPALRNGEPVSVHFPIEVSFNLFGQQRRR